MSFPIGLADLVPDQQVDRLRVRNPQQRLGQAQQRHSLARGQGVFVQECVDAALAEPLLADRGDEPAGAVGDPVAHSRRNIGRREDAIGRLGLINAAAIADRGPQRRCRRQRAGKNNSHSTRFSHAKPTALRPLRCPSALFRGLVRLSAGGRRDRRTRLRGGGGFRHAEITGAPVPEGGLLRIAAQAVHAGAIEKSRVERHRHPDRCAAVSGICGTFEKGARRGDVAGVEESIAARRQSGNFGGRQLGGGRGSRFRRGMCR